MMAGNFFDNIFYGSTWKTLRRQTTSSGNCRKHYQNLKANLICESGSVVFWWFGLKTKRHSMISFFFWGEGEREGQYLMWEFWMKIFNCGWWVNWERSIGQNEQSAFKNWGLKVILYYHSCLERDIKDAILAIFSHIKLIAFVWQPEGESKCPPWHLVPHRY